MKLLHRCAAASSALFLLAPVAACSSGSSDVVRSNKIAIVVASTMQDFGVEMMGGFKAGAGEVGGVEVLATGTKSIDGPKLVSIFQDAVKTHPGGVTLFTITPDLFAESLAAAGAAGVPLISMDTPPPPSSNVGLLVSNDNVELGRQLADTVAARLPKNATGTIIIGTRSPGAQVLDERAEGIRERFAKTLPGVKLLGPFDTKQDISYNLKAWRLLVRTNPDALAFMGTGDQDALSLAKIRQEIKGTWQAGGFSVEPAATAAIKSGNLVVIAPEHYTEGLVAGRLQAQYAKTGQKLPTGWIYVPGVPVTDDNVDSFIARQATDAARHSWATTAADKILNDPATYLRELPSDG